MDLPSLYETGKWEALWKTGIAPGEVFDAYIPLPELSYQIENKLIPSGRNALIPGCGRGYDVELLSRSNRFEHVYGVDVSPTGIEEASKYLNSVTPQLPRNWTLKACNFFDADVLTEKFDFVYDYTFLCTFQLEERSVWARRVADLLQVGGSLVTVMFPAKKSLDEGGPPFGLQPEMLEKVLVEPGYFVIKDGPRVLEDDRAHEGRGNGNTIWCRWERV